MKVSLGWIKDSLRRTMSDNEIVSALERAGIEVEQITSSNQLDSNIVVAEVKEVIQHPGADRLKIVTVDDGREVLSIVCGAPNVRKGIKVPLSRIGSLLPDGTKIVASKLRGEVSYGMLCSERELGFGDNHDGILELSADSMVGTALCDIYPNDAWIDIKTSPNRFDLLSISGLVREVAAMTDNESEYPPLFDLPEKSPDILISRLVDGCSRMLIAEIELDSSVPSPQWMVQRLISSGLRSINFLVDVTNYVMIETAQPLHAYDAAKITLPFGVRFALSDESLTTLDEKTRKLSADDLIVTDGVGPIGIAGVRGGAASEISSSTQKIYLEAATFSGPLIRQAAKRHNLRTDASARFERGVPPEAGLLAFRRAIELYREHANGSLLRWSEIGTSDGEPITLTVTAKHASKLLGIPFTSNEIVGALKKLSITNSQTDDTVLVTVPWWRPDLKESEDIIEEIVRVIGYDSIPATIPPWRPRSLNFDKTRPALSKLRNVLSGSGLFEVMTYSFVSEEQLDALNLAPDAHLKLMNPLSVEQAYLRTSLLPSHLSVVERNRTYSKTLGFYELSGVFEPKNSGEQPDEPMVLGLMVTRTAGSYRFLKGYLDSIGEAFNIKFDIDVLEDSFPWAPGRVGAVRIGSQTIGKIGQLSPTLADSSKVTGELAYLEIKAQPILDAYSPIQLTIRSRYPAVSRDVSIVVPYDITWSRVQMALAKLRDVSFSFKNDYVGNGIPAGHKSMTFHFDLTNLERTPTDAEADDLEAKIQSILRRLVGAVSRDLEAKN